MRTVLKLGAVTAAAAMVAAGLVATGSGPAVAAPRTLPQRPVVSASAHGKQGQIQALDKALDAMRKKIAAGSYRWGDLDLRDVFSYKVNRLWSQGIDGDGTAVAVLEGWNYPDMQSDLDALDATIGLPDTKVQTVYPDGPLPAQCPAGMVALGSYGSCDAWQGELRLDVEAVHLMAPYAKIVISATPSDSEIVGDPSSEVAMPEIVKGMEYISRHKLANVRSISDGSSETDYSHGAPEIHAQDVGEITAAAAGVPIANATGDCGAAQNLTTATRQCGTVSSGPASATWADSPWVTAIGGSTPQHTAPCPPCSGTNGEDSFPLNRIEGAGLSEMYSRPAYQNGIASITGSSQRSLPDITMNSNDGTSEAAPLFAGVLALATQKKGSNLGPINDLLYNKLSRQAAANGLVDVTSGNNTFTPRNGGPVVPGYSAAPGYDVASGWGTVDASLFVPALAKAAKRGNPMTDQAAAALAKVTDTLALTPSSSVSPTATVDVTSTGFLPGHPVTLTVDGAPLATVTADTSGNWSYAFTAAEKGFTKGKHTLRVSSLLLDQQQKFSVTS
ncbi:MAG: S53 family peptidase [Sciscionella sp.]